MSFKLALVQLAVTSSKSANVAAAVSAVGAAARAGANIVALPECFNCPYGTNYFPDYAEAIPGESTTALSEAASNHKVFVIGGSIPERDEDRLYNTCAIFDDNGNMLAKHRKIHLFDINVPGKIKFQESEILSPGDTPTIITTPWCKIGIGICYDIRFPLLAQLYAQKECDLLIYPGAFNMTTGPAHWELLQRSRAMDNQLFVAAVSPARNPDSSYVAWGHSSVVSPWGDLIATTDEQECIVYADIDIAQTREIRESIPIRKQQRTDIYKFEVI